MTTHSSAATVPDHDAFAALCPRCGFDLRGTISDRCGECGLPIDRTNSTISNIPWAHRRRIGRLRGFWKTVWRITADTRPIRNELVRPQEPTDAIAFRRVIAVWMAVAIGASGDVLRRTIDAGSILAHRESFHPAWTRVRPLPAWLQDVWVPWSAGISVALIWIACFAALGLLLPRVGRTPLRLKGKPAAHCDRAGALSDYASAPLAWFVPAAAMWVVAHLLFQTRDEPILGVEAYTIARWLVSVASLLGGAGLFFFFHRSAEWNIRASHAGPGRYAVTFAESLARSLFLIFTLLGIIPWCLGLGRIILDSVR